MARSPAGRYELYKRATDKFTDWLTRTARKCRDLTSETTLRPANKRSVTTDSGNVTARELINYAVTIRDAQQRVSATEADVPLAILALLEAVIDGRQASAQWHATRHDSDIESNESHQYFITALKQIRSILKPLVATSEGAPRAKPEETVASKLANIFSQLDVQEPSATPLGREARIDSSAATEDTTYVLLCHLEDLRKYMLDRSQSVQLRSEYAW